ncbi:uncharacterized protein LOC123533475 [Mercenaria mercenaria]|uniref:uncharacterized protein LOC123533475 n=1 Tax=Mercenaria mercenaria TaxID=6596 RepID=UPI00234E6C8C|nr:uncharacterized protein LOC123533475 [Mercenaria mercenaria]
MLFSNSFLITLCFINNAVIATYFEPGYDHHYTYSAVTDMLGMQNVTTVLKFRIRNAGHLSSEKVLNVMIVESVIQHSQNGGYADNPDGWDFTQRFYFVTETNGIVSLVYHSEDQDEVLVLKKVLAGTFSVNATIVRNKPGNRWTFLSKDLDHIGNLEHIYQAEMQPGGVNFHRTHKSVSDVHRHHIKNVKLDHALTPIHVETFDNVTFHRSGPMVRT